MRTVGDPVGSSPLPGSPVDDTVGELVASERYRRLLFT